MDAGTVPAVLQGLIKPPPLSSSAGRWLPAEVKARLVALIQQAGVDFKSKISFVSYRLMKVK